MVDWLEEMKQACQAARAQQSDPNVKLQDVAINRETGEFTFIWEEKK